MFNQLPKNPFLFALYFIKNFKWPLLAMLFLEAGQAASQILLPHAIKEMIDTVTKLNDSPAKEAIFVIIREPLLTFAGLSLAILICSRSSGALLVYVGPALRRLSRYNLYSYLQHHSHNFFTSNFSGSLANRINEVSVGINHSLWTIMFDFWPTVITFFVSMFLLAQTHGELALYLGSWILLYVTISFILAMKAQKYAKQFAAARSHVSGKIVDSVTNIINTQIFSRLQHEREQLSSHLDTEVKTARTSLWFMEKMRWFQFIAALTLQVGIVYMALVKWTQSLITVGEFTMVTSVALLIINYASNLSRRFLEFFEYIGNISDGVGMMIQDHEVKDKKGATKLKVQQGLITYQNISFRYNGSQQNLFENLNTQVLPGEKVGLVGFSGSGKSTFVSLMVRLYDVQRGEILIDGQNISQVTKESLRNSISIIPQTPMLFHRSLKENIRYGDLSATDRDIVRAAQMASAHEFIESLPHGYDSLVGEGGVKLSGGQRQRIAIARAILKNAPILVLDEATSSLDSKTEKLIQAGMKELMNRKTVVVVAHRLSTITSMDRILVFYNGKIIEEGSHRELLAIDGHYAMLWEMQSGGFLPLSPQDKEEEPYDPYMRP